MVEDKKLIGIESKLLPLKILKSTEGNPQTMSNDTFNGIVESMKRSGWLLDAPVIREISENEYQIISGHHRVMAGIKAGIVETYCKVLKGITDEQAKILVLEANQRRGSFDNDLLSSFIDDIVNTFDYDIDSIINDVGFDNDDINLLNGFIEDDKIREKEIDENSIDIKQECPKCGYKWS